jgi:hypothetical protein
VEYIIDSMNKQYKNENEELDYKLKINNMVRLIES